MKKNEFGEIEKKYSKIDLFIIIVAIVAIVITGTAYSKSLTANSMDTGSININVSEERI